MQFKNKFIVCIILTLSLSVIIAQTPLKIHSDSLSLDNGIKYGRLDNGFTYYIKPMATAQSKLFMRLIVRAGGNQQDADQVNISHAVEHMAFRSSKNFPLGLPNDKERIERLKMRNFRDFQAGNGAYYTRYSFNAPVNNPYAIKTALLWFKDIADGLNLNEEDIDKERGSLLQEFLSKNEYNLGNIYTKVKLMSQIYPNTFDYDNFLEHNKSFRPEVLRRYYRDWYRPDLMAITVVGNISNPDSLEAQIKTAFSDILPPRHPRKWKDTDALYYNRPRQFVVQEWIKDSGKAVAHESVKFSLIFRDAQTRNTIQTGQGLYRRMAWKIITEVLQTRFGYQEQTYNTKYTISSRYFDSYTTSGVPMAFNMTITSEDNFEKNAVKRTIQLLHQMKSFGLIEEEWYKTKAKWLGRLDKTDMDNADYWVKEINKHFVFGEALPSNKPAFLRQWLSGLSLNAFNEIVKTLITGMPEDIAIIAPAGHRVLRLTENEVRSWIREAWQLKNTTYNLPEVPHVLIPPDKESALKEQGYTDMGISRSGVREIILNNGIKIVIPPQRSSDGKREEKIILHGFSPKGASCFSIEDYYSAINAPLIVRNAGVGAFDKFKLKNFLSDTSFKLGIQPYVDYRESGIKGEAELKDLEKMLQLVYLYFVQPRTDMEAFEDWKSMKVKEYLRPHPIGSFDFSNSIKEIIGDSTYYNTGTKQFLGLQQVNKEKAYKCYDLLFGNAKDFTFIINGAFEIDSVMPLFQKYLGNLPNREHSLLCDAPSKGNKSLERGPMLFNIPSMDKQTDNVDYAVIFMPNSKTPLDWREKIKVAILGSITNDRLWPLRYEKGYSLYMITGTGKYNEELDQYQLTIKFSTTKSQLTDLQQEVNQIIKEIKLGLINEELFEQNVNLVRANFASGGFYNNQLIEHYKYHSPWFSQSKAEDYIKSLTLQDIITTARKYYKKENRYEFVKGN